MRVCGSISFFASSRLSSFEPCTILRTVLSLFFPSIGANVHVQRSRSRWPSFFLFLLTSSSPVVVCLLFVACCCGFCSDRYFTNRVHDHSISSSNFRVFSWLHALLIVLFTTSPSRTCLGPHCLFLLILNGSLVLSNFW